jgi:ribosome-binding factor A
VKPFSRAERVGIQLQRVLSELLSRQTGDPRITAATITRVEMTRDLRLARIYFAVYGDEAQRQAAAAGFRQAAPYLKRLLAPELALRYMPDLVFFYDDTFDHADRINRLLKSLQQDHADHRPPSESV